LEIERGIRDRFLTATMDGGISVQRTGNNDFHVTALDKRACELLHCSDSAVGGPLEQFIDNASGFARLAADALQSQSGPALLRQMEFLNLGGNMISANVYAVAYADSVALAFKTIDRASDSFDPDGDPESFDSQRTCLPLSVSRADILPPSVVVRSACPSDSSEAAEIHSKCGVDYLDFVEAEIDTCRSSAPTFRSDKVPDLQIVCGGAVTESYSALKHESFKREVSKLASTAEALRVAPECRPICSL